MKSKCKIDTPPGQANRARRGPVLSDYGVSNWREKQKVRRILWCIGKISF